MDNMLDMLAALPGGGPNPEYIVQKRRRMPGGGSVRISNRRYLLTFVGPEAPHVDPQNPANFYGKCYPCRELGEMGRWSDQGGATWKSFKCRNPDCFHFSKIKFWGSLRGDRDILGKVLCKLVWE